MYPKDRSLAHWLPAYLIPQLLPGYRSLDPLQIRLKKGGPFQAVGRRG